jgi:putative ABC transport system permease protein
MDVIKQAFLALPGVAGVTASTYVPGRPHVDVLTYAEMADGSIGEIDVNVNPVDFEFMDEYGLDLLAGRNFTPGFATDSTDAVVINEATVKLLGYASPDEAIGKTLRQWGHEREVIGVVRNFHFTSLRNEIAQMNFLVAPDLSRYLTVRVETDDLRRTLAELEQAWTRLAPQRPFNYQFLDDAFNAQYQAEERLGRIVGTFTLLAILVACLGLFGLASFTVQLRTKEIGVRKVLGASVGQIVVLLSRDFVRLVGVAFVLATPLAYFAMRAWLDDFAYRTTVGPSVILLAGLLALGIALLTVSVQSIRAAVSDPVHALRQE